MKDRISSMVDRFLGWKLPPTFGPDAGIKFTPSNGMTREEAYAKPGWWPIGTNLLTASEAREMLEHVTAVDASELSLRELDAIGRSYFNGPLNSNEEMFGRAVERAVRRRLLGTAGVSAALTPREVELLREIRVNFGNLDRLSADWRNEARNLLLRIEQGNAGVAGTLKENGNG